MRGSAVGMMVFGIVSFLGAKLAEAQAIEVTESAGASVRKDGVRAPTPLKITSTDPDQANLHVKHVLSRTAGGSSGIASSSHGVVVSSSHVSASQARPLCRTPCRLSLAPGVYDLEVSGAGALIVEAAGKPLHLIATPAKVVREPSGTGWASLGGMLLVTFGAIAGIMGAAFYGGDGYESAATPTLVGGLAGVALGTVVWTVWGYDTGEIAPGSIKLAR